MVGGLPYIGLVSLGSTDSGLDPLDQAAIQFDLAQQISQIDVTRVVAMSGGQPDPGPRIAADSADALYTAYGNDPQKRDAITDALRPYLNGDANSSLTQLANAWFERIQGGSLFGSGGGFVSSPPVFG